MQALLNRCWTLLFGYDVFVSYRRNDCAAYVDALVNELQLNGLICFVDREETVGGVKLTPALTKALRRSRTLIAVLTPGVLKSEWVKQEVTTFLRKPNRLVPINVGGFLASEQILDTPFAPLRDISWIDEQPDAVNSGQPNPSIITEITKSHRWLRVRTYARTLMSVILFALLIGGWSVGQFFIEEQRQAEVAYQDTSHSLGRLSTLMRFIDSVSTDYAPPELVPGAGQLDLANTRLPGPLVGFDPISPPGDTRPVVRIIAEGTAGIVSELDQIWRQDLVLIDSEFPGLVKALVDDTFMKSMQEAEDKLLRYQHIEDSNRQPFYLIGTPGVADKAALSDFETKVAKLITKISLLITKP
ncbi:MAG: toll/interleukin-1 receptor domain-containing protein [Candidatus Thiodiazotropha sp.]|nr:toll/interleukin-1 receptor domain-containing protein [Candidatus Thiodiazotropha sp.]MCM8885438.1 toll/interleukin-1 receptor domain-containing protein [Candidatus Thiodiazotropha sp.]